ncbi:MAG: VanZ family protein [Chloroflexota bacterium]|nr:VanZ family protein [Chloroflexota bacterium]
MGFFSSRRERRLWACALAVVATIVASLGFSGTLTDLLADDNVAAIVFGLALLLVVATILTDGLQSKPTHAEMAVAFGSAAVILMALLRLTLAERSHLIEYGVLAIFIHAALTERGEQGRAVRWPALVAILITAAIGVIDELIQLTLPHRVFDPVDMLFNTLAAATAVVSGLVLSRVRRSVRV